MFAKKRLSLVPEVGNMDGKKKKKREAKLFVPYIRERVILLYWQWPMRSTQKQLKNFCREALQN